MATKKSKILLNTPNSVEPEIVEIDKENWFEELKKALGFSKYDNVEFAVRFINGKRYVFWFDEEGMLKSKFASAICVGKYPEIIVGNLAISNLDKKGNLKSLTKKEIKDILNYGVCPASSKEIKELDCIAYAYNRIDGNSEGHPIVYSTEAIKYDE